MKDKLLPCPCCGAKSKYYCNKGWPDGHIISCPKCMIKTPEFTSKTVAFSTWNKRPLANATPYEEKPAKEIERLRNLLEDVVNELDLSESAIEKHGPLGTAPAVLVKEVLQEKDLTIRALRQGMVDVTHTPAAPADLVRDLERILNDNMLTYDEAYTKLRELTEKYRPIKAQPVEPLAVCGEGHPCPEKIRRVFEEAEFEHLPDLADRKGYRIHAIEVDHNKIKGKWFICLRTGDVGASWVNYPITDDTYAACEAKARAYLEGLEDKK